MKLSSLSTYFLSFLCLVCSLEANPRPVKNPPKLQEIVPKQKVRLKIGDEVYMACMLQVDRFNGIYVIDEDGCVFPKFCKDKVTIAGMDEVAASKRVLEHTVAEDVFTPAMKLVVIKASRFPKKLAE